MTGTAKEVSKLLNIDVQHAEQLRVKAQQLYIDRMKERFSNLRLSERLKRTNPFLLMIRGVSTVKEWATYQVQSALFASEEEAVGHLLEAIALICHPHATEPQYTDDFDFETRKDSTVFGYQVKMSWDCMPMSSRKNLSNTIKSLKKTYKEQGLDFVGYFTPCYGKATTTKPKGQEYISLSSREFWTSVGSGDENFDVKVGRVCGLLCADARVEIETSILPNLIDELTTAATEEMGDDDGNINYKKLFRRINK